MDAAAQFCGILTEEERHAATCKPFSSKTMFMIKNDNELKIHSNMAIIENVEFR